MHLKPSPQLFFHLWSQTSKAVVGRSCKLNLFKARQNAGGKEYQGLGPLQAAWLAQANGDCPSRIKADKMALCPRVIIIIFKKETGSISPYHNDASGHASPGWGVIDHRVSLKKAGRKEVGSPGMGPYAEGQGWEGRLRGRHGCSSP